MNRIVITDSSQFENVIANFEASLKNIKDVFSSENSNIEEINGTSTWSGKTQESIYNNFKKLGKNFEPIEDSIQLYINFMKKTLEDYKEKEKQIDTLAENYANELNVNS